MRIPAARKRIPTWIVAFGLWVLVWGAIVLGGGLLLTFGTEYGWTTERVEVSLGTALPTDARNVTFSGYVPRGGHLDLTFDAPPESALAFAAHFCDGELYQGFDPFHARVVDQHYPRARTIHMGWFIYYAVSEGAPDALYGIRCPFYHLTIDQRRMDLYYVHLLQEFHPQHLDEDPAEIIEDSPFMRDLISTVPP